MSRHVHFLGICGYAVSGAALVARQQGWRVSGSDDAAYPPTTDILTAAGIDWVDGSDPANLERWGVPDLVVVGNQTRPANPEWLAARERGLTTSSEIEFFTRLAADRHRIAVCGTHGKTTTSALLTHMLAVSGLDPGYRLGATSLDLGASAALGSGPFVFEGDEYTTAPWDLRPKFLHIDPAAACVTRLELDHPDVYPTLDAYRAPFLELAAGMPREGLLVLCADDPECLALGAVAPCRVLTYGRDARADWRIELGSDDGLLQQFSLRREGVVDTPVELTLPGAHNALNAAAALALALDAGAPLDACLAACASFAGPVRRFELAGDARGITVIDDYAHHPTEVAVALAAARRRYGARRLIAIHTPHTYSRTLTLLGDYARSFKDADVVVLGPIEAARERGAAATVSSADVARVSGAADVTVVDSAEGAIELVAHRGRPGDVVVVLSLGGFDKLAPRLVASLETADVA